jgi:predicted RNA-binding Zn ribbon-like protein
VDLGRARPNADWDAGFLFLGNQLTLDLLNTRPAPAGESIELLSDFSALVRWFQEAGLIRASGAAELGRRWGNTARGRKTLHIVRGLRESLRRAIIIWERGGAVPRVLVGELNRLMATYPMHTKLKRTKGGLATEPWFEARAPEDLIAPLAQGAASLFTGVDRKRVRKCGHCVAHFFDASKKGGRRWCSMQLCGNRLKVAAYAARQRVHR